MAIIQDAQTGRTAKVDDENRLSTFSVAQHEDKHTNEEGDCIMDKKFRTEVCNYMNDQISEKNKA